MVKIFIDIDVDIESSHNIKGDSVLSEALLHNIAVGLHLPN
jgi:hypothetical protein